MPSHTSSEFSMATSLALAFRSEELILLGHAFIRIHVIVGLCPESNSDMVSENCVRATFARNRGPLAADARRGEDDVKFGRRNGRR
jgi:hypothetical protein